MGILPTSCGPTGAKRATSCENPCLLAQGERLNRAIERGLSQLVTPLAPLTAPRHGQDAHATFAMRRGAILQRVFDDYSPVHPATQDEDAAARVSRMKWIADTFHAVVGSEGGSAYAAPAIPFAHGMMTPTIGWGDADLMKDKSSKFYLGRYYPPDGPEVFLKTVPMKPEYARVYADPKFRLPLYEIVFHDSVVATHQWGSGSLKFDDPNRTRELFELLYCVPPLYHLNLAEWAKQKSVIVAHYQFWSPLHRELATVAMTDFAWLTDDRRVQQTRFVDGSEITVNFGEEPWGNGQNAVPPHGLRAKTPRGNSVYPAEK